MFTKAPIKSRFTREEIPSGLGIALVGLFVFGLTAVAWFSIRQTQAESQETWRKTAQYSLKLLASVISRTTDHELWSKELRNFANHSSCSEARIVDSTGHVIASIDPTELGSRREAEKSGDNPTPGTDEPTGSTLISTWTADYPINLAQGSDSDSAPAFASVQVVFAPPQLGSLSEKHYAWVLGVILFCTVLLWFLYHRLRVHLHGVHRITGRLAALERGAGELQHKIRSGPALATDGTAALPGRSQLLEVDLTSLRIGDEVGAVTDSWNQLIDLAEELRKVALQASAANELQRVLERNVTGGDLAAALTVLPEGLVLIDRDQQINFVNEAAARLMNLGAEPAEGCRLNELALTGMGGSIASIVANALSSAAADGVFSAHTELLTDESDGSSYRVRVLPVRASGQPSGGAIVMVSDVSQQVRADRAREDFVSQVTHELRTPLTNIRAYAETLSSGMFDDPQVVTECYNVITKETRRLSRLIEDILSVSQLEVGSMELVIDDVDLRSLLTDTVRDMRGLAEEKRMELQLALPAKLPPFKGDRDKLLVIVNNLLGNALKYTPASGEVRVSAQVSGSVIQIAVQDNGIGIDPADHDRIFEKFQRSKDPVVQAETGTGIGLTTAREIAQRHGGNITLESAKGKGSTFILSLPLSGAPRGVNLGLKSENGNRNKTTAPSST